ncbi:MAG: dienelactone hydrolase family protein [Planctomycetes bacterium]|nr:dienelactone hydrolase family protein [Planctomycetota bacterium]
MALATAAWLGAGVARADERQDIFALLDRGADSPGLRSTVQQISQMGLTPDRVAALLREGRPYAPGPGGFRQEVLTDAGGRRSPTWVYVPEDYDPAKRYPLIVALHGLGANGGQMYAWLSPWVRANGFLLVAPSAQPRADVELGSPSWDPKAPPMPHWWKYTSDGFPLLALAWMKRRYNVDEDRVTLLGYSMGGYAAWNVGARFADRFCAVAPFAGTLKREEVPGPTHETTLRLLRNLRGLGVRFTIGGRDEIVPVAEARDIDGYLTRAGVAHVYDEMAGRGHVIPDVVLPGASKMKEAFEWLLARKRDADARVVEWTGLSADHGSARWVQVEKLSRPEARLRAEWTARGRLAVQCLGVKRFRVFVPDEWADPGGALTVSVDTRGKGGRAQTLEYEIGGVSLKALVESWSKSQDRALVYGRSAMVIVPETFDDAEPAAPPAPGANPASPAASPTPSATPPAPPRAEKREDEY